MASMAYEFHPVEKISDVASQFNTTVDEIMRVNNILPPYPQYVKDLPEEVIKSGTIEIPYVVNGRQSFESYYNTAAETIGVEYKDVEKLNETLLLNSTSRFYSSASFSDVDMRPGKSYIDCWISVDGVGKMYFPCYPTSLSDSNSANYSAVTILGRSEPFQYYTGSGPRSVSVSFQMHSDMVDDIWYIYKITDLLEACCYPNYGSGIAAKKVTLHVADNIQITGIIPSVSTNYSGPLLDMSTDPKTSTRKQRYAVVDVSFSVTEVTGKPPSFADIKAKGGRR